MKTVLATILAGSFTLALATTASAQSPQIPTPVNPYPINPIATNGTPLPSQSNAVRSGDGVYVGRSVSTGPFGFVGNVAGAGLDAAGSVVGAGVGAVGGIAGDRYGNQGYGNEGYGNGYGSNGYAR